MLREKLCWAYLELHLQYKIYFPFSNHLLLPQYTFRIWYQRDVL